MTNEQLVELFQRINKTTNCFDREIQLKKATKEYKKSEFYKQTHYSIRRAFNLYTMNGLNTLTALLNSSLLQNMMRGNKAALAVEFEELLDHFDTTKLDRIFEYLSKHFSDLALGNEELQVNLQQLLEGVLSKQD